MLTTNSLAERVKLLIDPGLFHKCDQLITHWFVGFNMSEKKHGDGFITGHGLVNGSKDFFPPLTLLWEEELSRRLRLRKSARFSKEQWTSGAHYRIRKQLRREDSRRSLSLMGYSSIFRKNVLRGIPGLSLIMGPCSGGTVYSPAFTHFILMLKTSLTRFWPRSPKPHKRENWLGSISILHSLGFFTLIWRKISTHSTLWEIFWGSCQVWIARRLSQGNVYSIEREVEVSDLFIPDDPMKGYDESHSEVSV